MRFSRHQLLALILGAGMATALPAQARVGGRGAGARGGVRQDSARVANRPPRDSAQMVAMRERIREGASPAGAILQLRERLGLTDDQVNRLETLKSTWVEPTPGDMAKLREELANASKGEANLTAVRAALGKINEASTNAVIARLDARNKARAVLNADQQVQFDALEARRPLQGGAMGVAFGRGGEPGGAMIRRGGRGGPPGTPPPPPPVR